MLVCPRPGINRGCGAIVFLRIKLCRSQRLTIPLPLPATPVDKIGRNRTFGSKLVSTQRDIFPHRSHGPNANEPPDLRVLTDRSLANSNRADQTID